MNLQLIKQLELRDLRFGDAPLINQGFREQGWNKSISRYHSSCFEQQQMGIRDVVLATVNKQFAGYLTISWESDYPPFKAQNIPEIVDFNVLQKFQRKGIGTALMEEAESRIKRVSNYSGIGFGLTPDYGAAQILYFKRGYIPGGKCLVKNGKSLDYGEEVIVGDDLVFYLVKPLV